jgi:YHS domain-containing protein
MLRLLLLFVLTMLVLHAARRLFRGFIEGLNQSPQGSRTPIRGVQMARDPVCGTFVVPERSVSLFEGPVRVFFCSEHCRDAYRARSSTQGRTA